MQLILRAKPEQENKVRWFNEWCRKNGKEIYAVLFGKVDEMKQKHSYPDFHTQLTVDYSDKPKMRAQWEICQYSSEEESGGLLLSSVQILAESRGM